MTERREAYYQAPVAARDEERRRGRVSTLKSGDRVRFTAEARKRWQSAGADWIEHTVRPTVYPGCVKLETEELWSEEWLEKVEQADTIAPLPTPGSLPPMTVQQLAGIMHAGGGTLGDVDYYPAGCMTCERAKNWHELTYPKET